MDHSGMNPIGETFLFKWSVLNIICNTEHIYQNKKTSFYLKRYFCIKKSIMPVKEQIFALKGNRLCSTE